MLKILVVLLGSQPSRVTDEIDSKVVNRTGSGDKLNKKLFKSRKT